MIYTIAYMGSVVLFFVCARFRYPVLPVLVIFQNRVYLLRSDSGEVKALIAEGYVDVLQSFPDVKANAADLLKRDLRRGRTGHVIVSSVTDPYQPVEATHKITRACMELLVMSDLKVSVLSKSGLISRDIDLFTRAGDLEAGLTITTDREPMRKLFEPGASPVPDRLKALKARVQGPVGAAGTALGR